MNFLNLNRTIAGAMAALAMALAPAESGAAEMTYAFPGTETTSFTGTAKKESYDIAIRISGRSFEGLAVSSMSVPLPAEGIAQVKGWLSKELTLQSVDGKKQNVPDIVSVDATVIDGMLRVSFPTPYVMDREGVYVGYSFSVETLAPEGASASGNSCSPVCVGTGMIPDGLYIHTSRSYRSWESLANRQMVSAMKVTLTGDFSANSVCVSGLLPVWCKTGSEASVDMVIANNGTDRVSEIGYTYEVQGRSGSGKTKVEPALEAVYGTEAMLRIPLGVIDERGDFPVKVTVTEVNGRANANANNSEEGLVKMRAVVPVRRPVMEEYTGTWCGNCVRGFAAMERMNKLYPDDFIAIAYHNDDPMATVSKSDYPSVVIGYPLCYIDRAIGCDPYYGTYSFPMGIEQVWLARKALECKAAVEITSVVSDSGKVDMTASCTFVEEDGGDYGVAFMLLENGMHGTDMGWMQGNYYANGANGPAEIPEMEKFTEGGTFVGGLKFDDVLVGHSDLYGNDAPLGAIETDRTVELKYTFDDISALRNLDGNPIVQNPRNLHAVALLVDRKSGQIANAAKCRVKDASGVDGTLADSRAEIVSTVYHDLLGRRVCNPERGVYIRTHLFSDGRTECRKIVIP